MNLVPLSENDLPSLNELTPDSWNDIIFPHKFYLSNECCYPYKVEMNEELIGLGTAILYQQTGLLAHIIVSHKHRNKGIGKFIVNSLLQLLINNHNCTSISLIASDLGYPVYMKCGFIEQSEYISLNSEVPFSTFELDKEIRLSLPNDLIDVLRLDEISSGEIRAKLIEPFVKDSFVYIRNNKILGYYLPTFGEGPIIANDELAGLALLKLKMKTCKRVVIPEENKIAYTFLLNNGYKENKRMKRMIHGKTFNWIPTNYYSRISGSAG